MALTKVYDSNNKLIGYKDEKGAFVPIGATSAQKEARKLRSIDDLLTEGLANIAGIMDCISTDVDTGMPSRETTQNLKDVMFMLNDLKKKEKEFLENLSDEELERLSKNA